MGAIINTGAGIFRNIAELAAAIDRAAHERVRLDRRASDIELERLDLLQVLDHAGLDAKEAEAVKVRRGIERVDMVLPEMRRALEELRSADAEAARNASLRSALDARAAAAEELDEALAQLGSVFDRYKHATGAAQRAAVAVQPDINVENTEHDRQLLAAISLHAGDFVRAAGIKLPIFNEPQKLAVSIDAIRRHFHWIWPKTEQGA